MLRIDDDFDEDQAAEIKHVDHVQFSSREVVQRGIVGWETALDYWRDLDDILPVDLVVSDVKFRDSQSPIARIQAEGTVETPNGLAYFLPFAAIARFSGRPLGVGVHTADAEHWRHKFDDRLSLAEQMLSLVAAQSIGQLAAILGKPQRTDIEGCWQFIEEATRGRRTFRDGVMAALQSYRKQLKGVRMLPDDWKLLQAWCVANRDRIQAGERVYLDDESDIGFTFMLDNGITETISFRSLFGDAELYELDFSFRRTPLHASCFELAEPPADDVDYLIDQDGTPRIGALVYLCREMAELYRHALEVTEAFPINVQAESNLTQVRKERDWPEIGAALGILFQDIHCSLALAAAWRRVYSEQAYDPVEDAFTDTHFKASLGDLVRKVHRIIKGDGVVTRDDIEVALDAALDNADSSDRGVRRIIECLKGIGVVKAITPWKYSVNDSGLKALVPPYPSSPPKGFRECLRDDERMSEARGDQLCRIFGFNPANGPNSIHRQVAELRGERTAAPGAEYLAQFRRGAGEPWVKALCRQFATSVHDNEADWPQAIAY